MKSLMRKNLVRATTLGLIASGCLVAFGQAHASDSFPPDTGPAHSWQQAAPWAPVNPNGTPDWKYDLGPLGNWTIGGGIDFLTSVWNNSADGPDSHHRNYGFTIPNAIVIMNGTKGKWGLRVWAGLPPLTPIVGWTGPGLNPNLHTAGSNQNPYGHPREIFKAYIIYNAASWFDVELGRIDSVDGTEIGIGWMNPTPLLSNLNNMQSTTADGIQFDFHPSGPASLSIQLGDGYNTSQISQLGFLGTFLLNKSGSDFIIGFGHTRLQTAGNLFFSGHVATFGIVNSNLIGFGGMWIVDNKYAISPEVEYQWLPKGITGGYITPATAPQTTYSNAAAMIDLTDQVNSYWQAALQVSYIHQHGDAAQTMLVGGEELNNIYGNYLGLGAPNGPGNLGQGSDLLGVQIGGTWMYKNVFVRPFLIYTHLANFEPGNGWGANGNKSSQVAAVLDVGFLFGDVKRN